MDIENITDIEREIQEGIIGNMPQSLSSFLSSLMQKYKLFIYIILILILAYIIFRIIGLYKAIYRNKRIKLTYKNTEKILSKLEEIEKKIEKLETRGKTPEKEKNKKSK